VLPNLAILPSLDSLAPSVMAPGRHQAGVAVQASTQTNILQELKFYCGFAKTKA
jgi:hypothetical protein